jgi:hypothetical protein
LNRRALYLLVAGALGAALLLGVTGCDLNTGGNTGTMRILLADLPATEVAEVHLRINAIEGMQAGRDPVTMLQGADLPVDIDVAALARRALLLGAPRVPAGNYSQLRLILSTTRGANWVRLTNGTTADLIPPANGYALARMATGALSITGGQTSTVLIDFNAAASIQRVGGNWELRPLVYASASDDPNPVLSGVQGSVLDARGRPLAPPANTQLGAFLMGPLGTVAVGEVSRRDGSFLIPCVLPGTYTVRLYNATLDWTPVGDPLVYSLNGAKAAPAGRINILPGRTATVNATVSY